MPEPRRTRPLPIARTVSVEVAIGALGALGAAEPPVVAVDLGATHLRFALAGGGVTVIRSYPTAGLRQSRNDGIVPAIAEVIRAEIDASAVAPVAIGIGIAAYVDRSGIVLQPRPFGLPAGPGLRERLAQVVPGPVVVDNDANLAAVGEVEAGAARGLRDVAVVTLGTNIGLGIVADGRLLRGAHGAAGEAGNLLVPARRGRSGRSSNADAGRLGRGTSEGPDHYALLEELVGGGALLRAATGAAHREAFRIEPSDDLSASDGIFSMAAAGDRRAAASVRHGIEGWAMLIADLSALLDPQAVVLSGGLAQEAWHFVERLRRRASELCLLPPEIRIGELGAQAGLVGAVIVARSALSARAGGAEPANGSTSLARGRASGSSTSRGEVGA